MTTEDMLLLLLHDDGPPLNQTKVSVGMFLLCQHRTEDFDKPLIYEAGVFGPSSADFYYTMRVAIARGYAQCSESSGGFQKLVLTDRGRAVVDATPICLPTWRYVCRVRDWIRKTTLSD